MDSFELNKIAAAVLSALLIGMIASTLSHHIIAPEMLDEHVYVVEGLDGPAAIGPEVAAVGVQPIEPLLANASVEAGAKVAKKCLQCHTFDKGGASKVGPNLWGVVGDKIARTEGFAYSKGMAEKGGFWNFQNLNELLFKPRDFIKGTKMAFAGLKSAQERANLVVYMNQQSNAPVALPAAAATAPTPETAPAPEAAATETSADGPPATNGT